MLDQDRQRQRMGVEVGGVQMRDDSPTQHSLEAA